MDALLDMDGVVTNFVDGLCRWFDLPCPYTEKRNLGVWDCYELLGLGQKDIDAALGSVEFWEKLRPMDGGDQIIAACIRAVGPKNVVIMSIPGQYAEGCVGKWRWLQRHLPMFRAYFCLSPPGSEHGDQKAFLAREDAILIDDSDANVAAYRDKCCPAILVPRPWNSRHALRDQAVEVVRHELETMMEEM